MESNEMVFEQRDDVLITLCRNEIVKLDVETRRLIEAVRMCQGSLHLLNQSVHDARGRLSAMEDKVNELSALAFQTVRPAERLALEEEIKQHRQSVYLNTHNLRSAYLAASEVTAARERTDLLGNGIDRTEMIVRNRQTTDVVTQSLSVSDSLAALVQQMDQQLRASEETLSTLLSSSKKLAESETEMRSMGGMIQSAGKLLSKYARRECTDKILFILAFVLFVGTVLYIMKKRLF